MKPLNCDICGKPGPIETLFGNFHKECAPRLIFDKLKVNQ